MLEASEKRSFLGERKVIYWWNLGQKIWLEVHTLTFQEGGWTSVLWRLRVAVRADERAALGVWCLMLTVQLPIGSWAIPSFSMRGPGSDILLSSALWGSLATHGLGWLAGEMGASSGHWSSFGSQLTATALCFLSSLCGEGSALPSSAFLPCSDSLGVLTSPIIVPEFYFLVSDQTLTSIVS